MAPEHGAIVELTQSMRALGVKRFRCGDLEVELHDAAVMVALTPAVRVPVEAGEIAARETQRREDDEQERLRLDFASA